MLRRKAVWPRRQKEPGGRTGLGKDGVRVAGWREGGGQAATVRDGCRELGVCTHSRGYISCLSPDASPDAGRRKTY